MSNKVDILAIGAHPDDVELSASGTLLKHIAMGKSVGIVDLTKGELGTRGSGELRLIEAQNAADLMGAKERLNLELADGFFEENKESLEKLIAAIRYFQPQIILGNAIHDRHPDHGRGASFIRRACFLSGLSKIKTVDKSGNPQKEWRPKSLYYYIQDVAMKPDFVVDISPYFEQKIKCIQAFKSQFFDPDSAEKSTPISGDDFFKFLEGRGRQFGRHIQVEFAEGFVADRPMGVEDMTCLL